jgi:hypothetical protein
MLGEYGQNVLFPFIPLSRSADRGKEMKKALSDRFSSPF